jgi:RNA polymerase sigma-70 factor, ECF subfamily
VHSRGQAISAWPFVFAVEETLDSSTPKIFPSAARLDCVLLSELIFMDVRTATNEQILTWTLGRTNTQTGGRSECETADTLSEISGLATHHSALLFRVAFSVLRHANDAEDVVQETFLRVLKNQRKLASIENPRIWLVRIAWNLALDRKRRLRSTPLLEEAEEILNNRPSRDSSAEITLGAAQGCARILRMIDKLPRKEQEVLRLSALEELDTPEIAAILKTTESSVRSCLFRARQRLRERLKAEERRKSR